MKFSPQCTLYQFYFSSSILLIFLLCVICMQSKPYIHLANFCYHFFSIPTNAKTLIFSIWIHPQGSQGRQKMRLDPLNMPFEVWCANIALERHKLRKTVKIGKKCQKTPVFIDFFKYSSIWGQY